MPAAEARAEIAATLAAALAERRATAVESGRIVDAARLQEIGKLYLPTELLGRAPESLAAPERGQFDSHYAQGRALARGAGLHERICTWILHARERWDGHGPGGLQGEEIPLGARIVAVTREYNDAPLSPAAAGLDPRAAALQRLDALSGTVLDPDLVRDALELSSASAEQ